MRSPAAPASRCSSISARASASSGRRHAAQHSAAELWLVCIGLFLIYTGFWGFYAACNIPIYDVQPGDGVF